MVAGGWLKRPPSDSRSQRHEETPTQRRPARSDDARPARCAGNILRSNAFTDAFSGDQYLYELVSRSNHSCRPNMEMNKQRTADGGRVAVLSLLRDVARGEDLVISYLSDSDLRLPVPQRRQILRKKFNFGCECERCGPLAPSLPPGAPQRTAAAPVGERVAHPEEARLPAVAPPARSDVAGPAEAGPLGGASAVLEEAHAAVRRQLDAYVAQLSAFTSPAPADLFAAVEACAEALRETEVARLALSHSAAC